MIRPSIPQDKRHNMLKARLLAPFVPRYSTLYGMRSVGEEVRDIYPRMLMSHDRKILFNGNMKVGSTSTKQLILKYSLGEYVERAHWQTAGVFHSILYWQDYEEAFRSADTFCFSLVRHPVDRFLSAYFHIFVDRTNVQTPRHLPAIRARGFDMAGGAADNLDVFIDYVAEAIEASPQYCDAHWREQHRNLGIGHFEYDFVGKLETYAQDIRRAFDAAGLGGFLDGEDWQKKRNASSRHKLDLTARQRARIEGIYQKDFEIFGYQ